MSNPRSFGSKGRVIAPSANDLNPIAKAVVLLAAGDITIVPEGNANGDTIPFTGCPVGFSPPYRVRRVTAASVAVATVED